MFRLSPILAGERQRLLQERCRALMVALFEVLSPQAQKREGNTAIVPHFPVELQRLPVQHDGVVEIGAMKRERARLARELRPRGRARRGRFGAAPPPATRSPPRSGPASPKSAPAPRPA